MVFKLQFQLRNRAETLIRTLYLLTFLGVSLTSLGANASSDESANHYLADAQKLYRSGDYFKSARYAFAAIENDPSLKAQGYAWVTMGLVKTGLYNAASYFFIKTLQSGDKNAIKVVLTATQDLFIHLNGDLLRKYLIRHTTYDDYDGPNKSAYLYSLAKEALLTGQNERAVGYLNGMDSGSPLWPFGLQLRGTANAILNKNEEALSDFRSCSSKADRVAYSKVTQREADDLRARCRAGEARTLYQTERFDEADIAYDRIPKVSIVWPDMLFEQAWNSFAKHEYNRTLGKLVSYKSPALEFVYNSEIEVLRAQSYLALCLYADANDTVNDFNKKYSGIGEEVKRFVENNANNMNAFYDLGKSALTTSLYTKLGPYRMANRFVRSPYFQNLVKSERDVSSELQLVQQLNTIQPGVSPNPDRGFPGFIEQVLKWRLKSIHLLGGTFVKNGLMDYHASLISNFEKMAFIKLEMLKRAKDLLIYKRNIGGDRSWGNLEPVRKNYQYYWSFNGEFWNDELGDYVFGLESECGK